MTCMSDITTVQMTLSRVITESGEMVVRFSLPEVFSAVEILGLLEAAKLQIYRDMSRGGR